MTDPFDALARPIEPQRPRPSFPRDLRARLVDELGLGSVAADPANNVPGKRPVSRAAPAVSAAATTPYLTVHHGVAAIEWYVEAFGAEEQFRVVGDDDLIGHAELTVGEARFMLSDEYPGMGVVSPRTTAGPRSPST